jgi:hypothetical protein
MALLGFKKRFAGKVSTGKKRQTIRAFRKYPIKVGDTLHLYTALRSKYARRLRKPVTCQSVELIHIHFNNNTIILPEQVISERYWLDRFAKADGFSNWDDMKSFWFEEHGVKKGKRKIILTVFKGNLIKW